MYINVYTYVCVYICACMCTCVSTYRGCSEKPENVTTEIFNTCSLAGLEACACWSLPLGQINNPSFTPRTLHIHCKLQRSPVELTVLLSKSTPPVLGPT